VVLTVVVIGLIPSRYAASMSLHRVPEYAALLSGSRALRTMTPRVRAIHTDFDLPPTADRGYLYRILGGEIAPDSPLVAVIGRGGGVRLEQPPD
jgi:hypothetical protein